MKKILLFSLALVLLACGADPVEKQGAHMLAQARQHLSQSEYAAAKDTILSLRRQYPTALAARRQAILLLDSIEMMAAADSLQHADSTEWERLDVKRRFFERKLQEDLKRDAK